MSPPPDFARHSGDSLPELADGFRLAGLAVDPRTNRVSNGEHTRQVEPKVMQVLLLLARHAGEPLTRERIMATVWSDVIVTDDTLTRCVSEARKIFDSPAKDDSRESIIDTIPRVGYRLAAPIEPLARSHRPDPLPHVSVSAPTQTTDNRRAFSLSHPIVWSVMMGVAALLIWQFSTWTDRTDPVRALQEVRPLTSMDGRERQPTFSPVDDRIAFVHAPASGDVVELRTIRPGESTGFLVHSGPAGSIRAPRWSADGMTLYFVGTEDAGCVVRSIPALGGPVSEVAPCGGMFVEFDISPDGRWLAMDGQNAPGEPGRIDMIDLFQLESGSRRGSGSGSDAPVRIPNDDSQTHDYAPRFSEDAQAIVFTRTLGEGQADLFRFDRTSGEVRRLSHDLESIAGHTTLGSGDASVYSAGLIGNFVLKTLDHASGKIRPLGVSGLRPTVDYTGSRVAFESIDIDADLIVVRQDSVWTACGSTRYDRNPALAPDGKSVVFISNRQGRSGLYRCTLTSGQVDHIPLPEFDTILGPAVGPDGRISFAALRQGEVNVFVLDKPGAQPRQVSPSGSNDMHPAFSPDGKWVYFASDRSGEMNVWRTPVGESRAEQITYDGAIHGRLSPDGRWLYYQRTPESELWRMPAPGMEGQPVLVARDVSMSDLYHWQPSGDGVLLARPGAEGTLDVAFIDAETGEWRRVRSAATGRLAFGFTADADLSTMVGAVVDRIDADLMVADLPD